MPCVCVCVCARARARACARVCYFVRDDSHHRACMLTFTPKYLHAHIHTDTSRPPPSSPIHLSHLLAHALTPSPPPPTLIQAYTPTYPASAYPSLTHHFAARPRPHANTRPHALSPPPAHSPPVPLRLSPTCRQARGLASPALHICATLLGWPPPVTSPGLGFRV